MPNTGGPVKDPSLRHSAVRGDTRCAELHTDYALRVLIQVALNELNEGELTTINDIAESFDISKHHLMKVVNDLSQKGYLDTIRGRNGGIRLMRKPRDINVGQVVRALMGGLITGNPWPRIFR